jgi:two-component system, NarL family, sensor kinase
MESDLGRLADGLLSQLESDRARIAGLLGDDVVSVLTMSRYLIEEAMHRLARGELEETSETLRNATARIRDASQQLSALCSDLRPKLLDDLGLLPALSCHLRDFSRDNRAIFVSPRITVTERDVPAELKLPLYRVVQGALSNVARHSKASAARVCLSLFEDELRLVIEDDGVGFDAEHWCRRRQGPGHCGLGTISRLVETSGGQCTIEATPRHGARVQAIWRLTPAATTADSKASASTSALGAAASA